ncbi:MAG TPA: alpha/beta fold hydrolase [Solirubrobacteraceae bacterium]|nr:alpha/beta fold hydrolase [Solirubrobacteraceae bacterium]
MADRDVIDGPLGQVHRGVLTVRNGLRYGLGLGHPRTGRSPKDRVWRMDKVELWRYRNDQVRFAPPVLIVHSLVSRPYIFDLLPGNSVVAFLRDAGYDVFLLDWGLPDPADACNTLETYVDHSLPRAVEATRRTAGSDEVTMLAYCVGGVLAVLYAARYPDAPLGSLIATAAPADYTKMGLLTQMFAEGRLEADAVIDGTGNVPGRAINEGMAYMKPSDRLLQAANQLEHLWDERYMEGYLAMRKWARDQVPFPGETLRQVVELLVRENALMSNTMRLGGEPVDLRAVRCPFLNVVAARDHQLVPVEACEPYVDIVGSGQAEELRLDAGHVGLFAGREAANVTLPSITEWINRHSTPLPGAEKADTRRRGTREAATRRTRARRRDAAARDRLTVTGE